MKPDFGCFPFLVKKEEKKQQKAHTLCSCLVLDLKVMLFDSTNNQ